MRDVGRAYEARRKGRSLILPPLPVQYADYTLWQQECWGKRASLRASWRANSGSGGNTRRPSRCIELPTDRPRPAVASHRGAVVPIALSRDLHAGLVGLARACGASLFMVLNACLARLLTRLGRARHSDWQPDCRAHRQRARRSGGLFCQHAGAARGYVGNPSLRELIGRVRAGNLAAYSHQDVPFERLVEVLNPPRSLSHHPLFQVMLAFQNNARPRFEVAGLAAGLSRLRRRAPSSTCR